MLLNKEFALSKEALENEGMIIHSSKAYCKVSTIQQKSLHTRKQITEVASPL